MNNVLCIKWGNKYSADYVNKLHSMVSRNLSIPFRFICLTEDKNGINPKIEVKPIPKIDFEPFDTMQPWTKGNGWLKLTSFINPLYDISGKILFLDLDIVITGELDSFFNNDFPFTVIRDWSMTDGTGNTSVYLYTAGEHNDALDEFKINYQKYLSLHRNEQEYITQYLMKRNKVNYWPSEWCVSFKYHCMGRGLKSWIKKPQIPYGAKIVVFHGEPNPPDAIIGKSPTWYKRVKPTKWVNDLWR